MQKKQQYYYDNAATSFPKPREVAEGMQSHLQNEGGTYGRSFSGRTLETSKKVELCRETLAHFLKIKKVSNLCFTFNATAAINTVISGLDLKDKTVWVSPLEHNAVMRPLRHCEETLGTQIKILPHRHDGLLDLDSISCDQKTALVIVNHMSNVNGLIQPIQALKEKIAEIPLLVDAAQSAGSVELYPENWNIDYVAMTGHKSLLGPTGTGALYFKNPNSLEPFLRGGTGSRSESDEMPLETPDRFEAGTPNVVGIVGLLEALKHRPTPKHQKSDFLNFIKELKKIPHLKVHSAADESNQGELVSINSLFKDCASFGYRLYEKYEIETRVGLHCAPLAHKTLGTFPEGTLRIAPSPYHAPSDFDFLLKVFFEEGKK